MHVKPLRLMNLPSHLYHDVWSTSPFGGMRASVDCPARDSRHVSVDYLFRYFGRISQESLFLGGLPLRVFQTIYFCVDGLVEPSLLAYR